MSSNDSGGGQQFCFLTEWWDSAAAIARKYQLFYFTLDDTIEMYDLKNRRTFLKRVSYPSVKLSDLYPGAQISVYARQLKVLDFGDEFTRTNLGAVKSKTIAVIKPGAIRDIGTILDTVTSSGLQISRLAQLQLTMEQSQQFYGDKTVTQRAADLAKGPIIAIELVGPTAQQTLFNLADPRGSSKSSSSSSSASTTLSNVHVSQSQRTSELESEFLFQNPQLASTASPNTGTLCLIKPHALPQAGSIIRDIQESSDGFHIQAMEMFHLDREAAQEFLEVYKGVVPEYNSMVEQFMSGPCIAIQVVMASPAKNNSNTVEDQGQVVELFREFAGPSDPEIARRIRPGTLRAKYGLTKVKNAIHVTDLPEDGTLESEFFFNLLHNQQQK